MAMIEFDRVSKRFAGGFTAVDDLSLRIEDGEFMIFVGPSGCGKTTALRMIAGLEEVSSGDIRIGGRSVARLDPQDRDVAMVFQNYALYPHKSIRENVGFPLRMRGMARGEIDRRVNEVAKMLGIEALLDRKPKELSGGQRQRVAMGRAIVRHPQAFLMDEPLSNLDAKLRIQMRVELVRLHRRLGVTTIYVTHDQTEAMTLGQRVVVLNKGKVQQVAPPHQLYMYPANAFVAGFIGSPPMNFLRGMLTETGVHTGPIEIALPAEIRARVTPGPREVLIGIRPEALTLVPSRQDALVGEVEVAEELGAERYLYLRVADLDVVEQSDRPAELAGSICARLTDPTMIVSGETVALRPRPEAVCLFDEATGDSRIRRE
ncbi:MAG TPA: sn-glycerol-3-phosphate ABC transporter ATP-binding protein UgpC [Dongiaceae bacterium]|nr:sn-glycerol-3-phosphate ABC transporter ATP-binding protein UgpC [Dongiaceae bacterium]